MFLLFVVVMIINITVTSEIRRYVKNHSFPVQWPLSFSISTCDLELNLGQSLSQSKGSFLQVQE